MKTRFNMKKLLIPLLATALLSGSCSKWTEPEHLDYRRPTPEEQNPEAYKARMEAIREYKKTDHKLTMVTMEGISEQFTRQYQRPTSMPDSLDYICVTGENLTSSYNSEISKAYSEKGIQTLYMVDYMTIEAAWTELEDAKAEAGEAAGTVEEYSAFCRERLERMLSYCDTYGFHGIEVSYTGNTASDIKKEGQRVLLECVKAWRETHKEHKMLFRGYMQNLKTDNSILAECDYLVVLAGTAASASRLNIEVQLKLGDGVPTDRFIMEVSLPTEDNPTQVGATPKVAAEWVMTPEDEFVKTGIAINNIKTDYHSSKGAYSQLREAMSIMNPVPNTEDNEQEGDKEDETIQ